MIVGGIIIVLVLFFVFVINRVGNQEPKFNEVCLCNGKTYNAKGRKSSFVVSGENGLDFLVNDGIVVAVRDCNTGSSFVYYKGDEAK